jgi:hypothetical protein
MSPEAPSQWLMVSGDEAEQADVRLYQQLAAHPEQGQQSGSAWFIGITRDFTGCPNPRADLERVARSWFEYSGLAPLLAQVDADAQAVTFWKAVEVTDPTEAIRIAAQGIERAIEHAELGKTVRAGFSIEVIAERDSDDQH